MDGDDRDDGILQTRLGRKIVLYLLFRFSTNIVKRSVDLNEQKKQEKLIKILVFMKLLNLFLQVFNSTKMVKMDKIPKLDPRTIQGGGEGVTKVIE